MLGRIGQGGVGLEVPDRLAPFGRPVGGQSGQLPHGGHAGRLFGHGLDGPQRILVAPSFVGAVGRLGLLHQPLPVQRRWRRGRRCGSPPRSPAAAPCGSRASTSAVLLARRPVGPGRVRPSPVRAGSAVSSHSSRDPSILTHGSGRGGGAVLRRSCSWSSENRAVRCSPSCRPGATSRAPGGRRSPTSWPDRAVARRLGRDGHLLGDGPPTHRRPDGGRRSPVRPGSAPLPRRAWWPDGVGVVRCRRSAWGRRRPCGPGAQPDHPSHCPSRRPSHSPPGHPSRHPHRHLAAASRRADQAGRNQQACTEFRRAGVNDKSPPSELGGLSIVEIPAATYSPRGPPPKYHRRGRA